MEDEKQTEGGGPVESEMATRAEEPIEDRLLRAYANGFRDGLMRGAWGRYDHS